MWKDKAVAKKLGIAYGNLSTMLEAGLPVLRSLDTLSQGLRAPYEQAFLRIRERISKGSSFSDAMSEDKKVFAPLDIMIINSAETGGTLGESFNLLSHWHEFSDKMGKLLLSGLILPAFVITIASFVIPIPSQVLGGLDNWSTWRYFRMALTVLSVFYVPAIAIYCIVRYTPKTGPLRRFVDIVALRIPGLGSAIYRLGISRYCRVFQMLSSAGVPITECVEKSGVSCGNAVVASLFEPMAGAVKAGKPSSQGLSTSLPAEFRGIWEVGEETGSLDSCVGKLADNYAYAAEFRFRVFARWFPIFVYVCIAIFLIYNVFVGFTMIYGNLFESLE